MNAREVGIMTDMHEYVLGLFAGHRDADAALDALAAAGVRTESMGLLVPPIERRTETGVGPLGPAGALEARGVKPAVADHAIAHYRNGGTVLLVSGDLPADTISEIMQRCGALEVHLNASEATVAARSESAGRVAGRSQPAHGAGDSPVDGGLLRDADTSERHGRGVEPNVAPSGHPLSEDIAEERKHTP
jgi:hypothetical protein